MARVKLRQLSRVCCKTILRPSRTPSSKGIVMWAMLLKESGTASVKPRLAMVDYFKVLLLDTDFCDEEKKPLEGSGKDSLLRVLLELSSAGQSCLFFAIVSN